MRMLGLSTIDSILPAPKFLFNAAPQNFTSFDNTSNLRFNFNPNLSFRFQKSMQRAANSSNSLRSTRVQCSADGETDDGFYIRRCVELARKGMGFTSPNPMVGCIIVKDGKIVGQGFHPKAGQPHAEVFALRDAGDLAENATAYVSLEPCNHYGRTPPCTEALIKARVRKVVVGMVDPNPIVASKGIERLRNAGIEVVVGVEEELCKRLIEAFSHRMLTGRPLLTIRYSLSVDGHFVDQLGEGVTDSGGYYSQLLQEYDAVVLSSSLFGESISVPSTQESGANQPSWLIVQRNPSSSVQVPLVVNEATDKTIIFTDKNNAAAPEMSQKGIETVAMDRINLDTILDYCHHQGLCSVLLDLRGNLSDFEELIKEGIEKKYFNKLVAEILPVWNGYGKGHTLMALHSLEKGPKLTNLQSKTLDQSVVIEGYFNF